MSNHNPNEKLEPRKSKVSVALAINHGLVGPKAMAKAAADGKLLWEMPYSEVRYIATTPIVDGSTLIVAGPGSGMTAFKMKLQEGKFIEEKLWTNADNSVVLKRWSPSASDTTCSSVVTDVSARSRSTA